MASRGTMLPAGIAYRACALSFVLHPQSPFIPTLRGDVRVFAADGRVWAGGGADLTVCYVDTEAFIKFHQHWKSVCDQFDPSFYTAFKEQCDKYFYIPSREEYRGIGGIFYDELQLSGAMLFDFQKTVVDNFLPSFSYIVQKNLHLPWSEEQKRWQRIRRGRYLEFNFLNDRGVRFGLAGAPSSRTDAILISAPPSVEWPYRYSPDPGTPEYETQQLLAGHPVNWLGSL